MLFRSINYTLISGILGKLATKMFATCLLAPQQFYLQLKLAPAEHVLQLSSDPCRRISGTVRDYVRNIGQGNCNAWGDRTYTTAAATGLNLPNQLATSAYGVGYVPAYSVPIVYGNDSLCAAVTTSLPNAVFTRAASIGAAVFVPTQTVPIPTFTPIGATAVASTGGGSTVTYTVPPLAFPVRGGTILVASGFGDTTANGDFVVNTTANAGATGIVVTSTASPGSSSGTVLVQATGITNIGAIAAQQSGTFPSNVQSYAFPPAPQYVPMTAPWAYKNNQNATTYATASGTTPPVALVMKIGRAHV